MLTRETIERFTKLRQTSLENVAREYCQHLFLSYLYQNFNSEKLLFKGGTALRLIWQSPRFSEDLDFTGIKINRREIESLLAETLTNIEKTGLKVEINEAKNTSGGYLGSVFFWTHGIKIKIQIEISLRHHKNIRGTRALIPNDYLPAYTLIHLPLESLIQEKLQALFERQKPRDFYDYYFLLSGNYPLASKKNNLQKTLNLLEKTNMDFKKEMKKFLPASQAAHLKDLKNILRRKIKNYLD